MGAELAVTDGLLYGYCFLGLSNNKVTGLRSITTFHCLSDQA